MQGLFQNLVAWWKMDDNAASTTVVDETGNYNGTAQQNTDGITTTGKINGALTFNGTSDYIDASDDFSSTFQNSFSVSFWCKPDDGQPSGVQTLLQVEDSSYEDYWLINLQTDGSVYASYNANLYGPNAGGLQPQFSDGASASYKFIAVVFGETTTSTMTISLYVNGELVESNTDSCVMDNFASDNNLKIGVTKIGAETPLSYFAGSIDDVMIFNKALSVDEVARLYNSGNGVANLAELDDQASPRKYGTSNLPLRARYEFA